MDCKEARLHLLDRRRGLLSEARRLALDEHLAGCPDCAHENAADRELSTLLETRLPRLRAPESLRQALGASVAPRGRAMPRRLPAIARGMGAMALGAALALLVVFGWRAGAQQDRAMLAEAVNDHLRVLYSAHPVGVESSEHHVVKPWFEGRLEFAPVVFEGDQDFALQGGEVGYFLDRRAATLVYRHGRHLVTLFEFPAEGLAWDELGTRPIGRARGTLRSARGFHVLSWRDGDLGYALVSDMDEGELVALGGRIVP